jgi:hypothetical protein
VALPPGARQSAFLGLNLHPDDAGVLNHLTQKGRKQTVSLLARAADSSGARVDLGGISFTVRSGLRSGLPALSRLGLF